MISSACRSSTRSAFRFATFPAALVPNGVAFAFGFPAPTPMNPPCVPLRVANSNARPFLRLFARMHGSRPGALRQP